MSIDGHGSLDEEVHTGAYMELGVTQGVEWNDTRQDLALLGGVFGTWLRHRSKDTWHTILEGMNLHGKRELIDSERIKLVTLDSFSILHVMLLSTYSLPLSA